MVEHPGFRVFHPAVTRPWGRNPTNVSLTMKHIAPLLVSPLVVTVCVISGHFVLYFNEATSLLILPFASPYCVE